MNTRHCSTCSCDGNAPQEQRVKVRIDGIDTVLRLESYSVARGYQYLTPGNTSLHSFAEPLRAGMAFRTNGHHYEVIG